MHKRVVVTGLGAIASTGTGKDALWKALLAGTSGISKVESFDTKDYGRTYGGEIKDFDPLVYMDKRQAKRIGRASQLAIAATTLAFKDAHIDPKTIPANKNAVLLGTTMGEASVFEKLNKAWFEKGLKKVNPFADAEKERVPIRLQQLPIMLPCVASGRVVSEGLARVT